MDQLTRPEESFDSNHQVVLELLAKEEPGRLEEQDTIAHEFRELLHKLREEVEDFSDVQIAYDKLKLLKHQLLLGCTESDDPHTMADLPVLERKHEEFAQSLNAPGVESTREVLDALEATHSKIRTIKRSIGPSSVSIPIAPVLEEPTATPTTLRPRSLPLPTFSGDYMEWSSFIENFTSALDKFSITREAVKVAYLKAALKSRESQNLVEDETKAHSYSGMMKRLEARYYRPRKVFRQIVQGLFTSRLPSELDKAAEVFHTQVMGAAH